MQTAAQRPGVQVFTGLGMLLVAMANPGLPACTGMALVALGATAITIERIQCSPARTPWLLTHGLVYGAIYVLFVGATFDAASRKAAELTPLAQLDLAVSVLLMTTLAHSLAADIRRALSTEQ